MVVAYFGINNEISSGDNGFSQEPATDVQFTFAQMNDLTPVSIEIL